MNTHQEVLEWLISHKVSNFSINEDLTVDVKGNVNIGAQDIIEIPIQFGVVTGFFNCAYANLKSLKGVPQFVDGSFYLWKQSLEISFIQSRRSGRETYENKRN